MKTLNSMLLLLFVTTWAYSQTTPTKDFIVNKNGLYTNLVQWQDYDGDGDLDIVAIEEGNSRSDIDKIVWLENESTKQWPKRVLVEKDLYYARDFQIADIDKDGLKDYVVSTGDAISERGELVWFQRQLDGTYIKWSIDVNPYFEKCKVADFDGDGDLDVIGVGLFNDFLNIYFSDGFFFSTKLITKLEYAGQFIDADDIDNDGDIDFVIGCIGSAPNGSRVFYNEGKGTFKSGHPLISYNSSQSSTITNEVLIVDLNNDNKKDVIGFGAIGGLNFYDGADSFKGKLIEDDSEWSVDIGGGLAVADIDGNGLKDIIRHHYGSGPTRYENNRVSILYQTSPLVFKREYLDRNWNGSDQGQISFGDMDRDGDIDVVMGDLTSYDADISIYENIKGTLYRHQPYSKVLGINEVKALDLDNDSDLDIVVTAGKDISFENEIIFYENQGNHKYVDWLLFDRADEATDIEYADSDNDGDKDLFVTAKDASDLLLLKNDGLKAKWAVDTIDPNANNASGIIVGDFDKDGNTDVALCANGDAKVFWYKNNGKNSFSKRVVDANLKRPLDVEAADFDGDGDLDLAVIAEDSTGYLTIYGNNGLGVFTKKQQFRGFAGTDLEVGDLNQDGKIDIFISVYPVNGVKGEILLATNKNGMFELSSLFLATNNIKILSLKYADIDSDEEPDLIFGYDDPGYSNKPLECLMFKKGKTYTVSRLTSLERAEVRGIDFADLNKDDKVDIIFADYLRSNLVISQYPCFNVPPINLGKDTTLKTNSSIVLSQPRISEYSYRWSTGTTSNSITVRNPGTYSLTVTNNYGCPVSDTILVRLATDVKNIEELGVSLFPNPANEKIILSSKGNLIPNGIVEFFNFLGQAVKTVKISLGQQIEIDISDIPNGAYLLFFRGDDYKFATKILKN